MMMMMMIMILGRIAASAWSVCLSVGRSICHSSEPLSPAKTAEPIEMPFGLRTGWADGPRNHVLVGV